MEHDEVKRMSDELEELLNELPDMSAALVTPKEETQDLPELTDEELTEEALEAVTEDSINIANDDRERSKKGSRIRVARINDLLNGCFHPSDGLWAAFLVPVIIMIVIFIQRGIFPFGEESFLRTDMYHQYAPFFSEFKYKLSTGGSLLYSWDVGMGVNFSALYAYYLASPLNWLIIFCPKAYVIEFMTYMIVFKIGLAGLSFSWYLRKHFDTDNLGTALFGIFYALSGYMAAYSWNIMWLDCIVLFPIVMLGLERLVRENKGLLYSITLGICILSNYYISIMICIFMVIYFAALWILKDKKGEKIRDFFKNCAKFAGYSLAAGGLSAVVLLPELYALRMTASGEFTFPRTVTSYFSIFDMIARHIGNVEVEIGLDHWPNIYCGVAVLMLFLLYLGCKKINIKEKAVYCGLLLIFFASFSVNILNFIWHGLHYPNSLPCRQSFIYIALVLTLCFHVFMHFKDIPWKHMAMAFAGSVIFVILAEKLVTQDAFKFWMFYVAILFLAAYAGLMYWYKCIGRYTGLLMIAALGLVSVEAAVNTTLTSVTITSRTAYVRDNEEVEVLADSLLPSDTFYRIEKVTNKTKNDGAWMNFPSVSLFSSTANANITAFFKYLGCEGSVNSYSINGSTPLVDSLFSVRYGLYSEEQLHENETDLSFMRQEGSTYLYKRNDTLPLGFMVSPDLEDSWMWQLANPASVQNDLCDVIGADRVLIIQDGINIDNQFYFTPEISGDYYAFVSNKKVEEVRVTKPDDSLSFKNVNRGYLLELGWCEAGEEIILTGTDPSEPLTAEAYRFDYDALHTVYEILDRYPIELLSWTDTSLDGMIDVEKDGILFTSIPYDKGWKVTVDDVRVDTIPMFDSFTGIELTQGLHLIHFSYMPQGLILGGVITVISILCLAAAYIIGTRRRNMAALEAEQEEFSEDQEEHTEKTMEE